MPKKKCVLPFDPELVGKEFIQLKSEKLRIDRRCDELKKILEPYLAKIPEKCAILAGWKFSLIETTRESFRLSDAKEKLSLRVLKPFITSSTFTQIRTFWDGGEEEPAEAA